MPRSGSWSGIGLALGLGAALAATATAGAEPTVVEDGVLDWIRVEGAAPPADAIVIVRPFDSSGADLGTGEEGGKAKRVEVARKFQEDGPAILADEMTASIRELGPFTDVRLDDGAEVPEGAVVIDGRFTRLNPGSRAKRYWAGFGAGKGVVEIEGRVLAGDGTVLAEFRQRRLTVMGVFGGDYESKMRSDLDRLGADVAEFLSRWVRGGNLAD